MELIPQSANLMDYLEELDVVNFSHPFIQNKIHDCFMKDSQKSKRLK